MIRNWLKHRSFRYINYVLFVLTVGLAIFLIVLLKLDSNKKNIEASKLKAISDRLVKEEQLERERIQGVNDSLPRIVCWGDSLTAGAGGNGITYPSVLSSLIKLDVKNYGINGEKAEQIAERQGALPIYVKHFVIPKDLVPVSISLKDEQGKDVKILRRGDAGVNPCYINDIQGTLSYDEVKIQYYFTRTIAGEQTEVIDNTRLITDGMQNKKDNDIVIIFSGTNDLPNVDTIDDVIKVQKRMLEYANTDNYVILGLTSKNYMPQIEEVNDILHREYGDKYLDIREYLLTNGLKDAGITPTEQDKIDIANGEIPTSLRSDNVHGNYSFYTMIGNQLYNKIIDLGYLSSDQLKVLEINE